MPEKQFGPYRLVHQIATGGMAEIYLAKTKGIGGFEKFIALKMIHPNYSSDDHFVEMLVDEAKISVQLQHVNIAQVFDLGRVGDTFYITMEFVDGCDLYKILRRASEQDLPMPIDVAVHIAKEACMGLDYAHRKRDVEGRPMQIVHRDVSPQNVLVSYAAEVKVVDFGIAKAAMRAKQTAVGVIKGKYYYMSPEQAWGDPLDHRTDIFSTGILLYEMLTGQMLYLEEDLQRLLDMVRKAEIPPPSSKRRDVPPELDRLVMKALCKKREQRWPSAHDFGQELERFLHGYAPDFTQQKVAAFVRQAVGEPAPVPPEETRVETGNPGARVTRGMSRVDLMDRGEFAGDENSVIFSLEELKKAAPAPAARAANPARPAKPSVAPPPAPRRSAQAETQRPSGAAPAPPPPASGAPRPAAPAGSPAPRSAAPTGAPRPAAAPAGSPAPRSPAPTGAPRPAAPSGSPPPRSAAPTGAPAPRSSAPTGAPAPAPATVPRPAAPRAPAPAPAPAPPVPAAPPPGGRRAPLPPPTEEPTMISGPPGFGAGAGAAALGLGGDDTTSETTLDRLLDDQPTGEAMAVRGPPITEERSDEEPTRLDVGLPAPPPARKRAQTPTATAPAAPPVGSPPTARTPSVTELAAMAGDRPFDDDDVLEAPTTRRKGSELPVPVMGGRNPRPAVSAIAPARPSRRTPATGVPITGGSGQSGGAAMVFAPPDTDEGGAPHASSLGPTATPTDEALRLGGLPTTPTPGPLPSPTPSLMPSDGAARIPLSAPVDTPLPGPLPGPPPGSTSLIGDDPWGPVAAPYPGPDGDTGFTDMAVDKLRGRSSSLWWFLGAALAVGIVAAVIVAARSGPPPAPTTASIEVISIPAGATVKIDGVAQTGVTPYTFAEARPGKTYRLGVELAKHEPWSREEPVPEGTRQVKVIASLRPILGKLVVSSEPSGADVFLNNRPVGRTPLTLPSVDPFVSTKIELRLRGHKPAVETVAWTPPYEATMNVKLAPSR